MVQCKKDYWDAETTAKSYGITPWWGKPQEEAAQLRKDMAAAVPPGEAVCEASTDVLVCAAHKQFLKQLEWIVDIPVAFESERLICLHAGLHLGLPAEEQIELLKGQRDCNPALMTQKALKIDQLRGRAATFPEWFSKLETLAPYVGRAEGKLAVCTITIVS